MADEVREVDLSDDGTEETVTEREPIIAGTVLPGIKFPMSDKEEEEWVKTLSSGFKERDDAPFTSVVRDLNKVSYSLKLNNGTHDGKVQTVSLSLGTLNKTRYDDQKAMNIAALLKPCLSKNVVNEQETKVSILTAGE